MRTALQRTGIGSHRMTEGLARLKALGAEGCVVPGEPACYGRCGLSTKRVAGSDTF